MRFREMAVRILSGALVGAGVVACGPGDRTERGDSPGDSQGGSPPVNVVLITLDTTRVDALSLYGNERLTTPEIDRFASRGVVFDLAYTAQPSTLPSHSTIMTGRLPFAHGARANAGYVLAFENETLAEVFSRNGYVTSAEIAAPVIGRRTQLNQGFQHYRDLDSFDVRRKVVRVRRGSESEEQELIERDAVDITAHGVSFIRQHLDTPFFLWLHYFDPHSFYAPPPPWNSRFADVPYYSEVHFMDYYVGRVVEELRRQGISERTLVVITSDHGEGLGEHDELSHSYYVYDTTMRVPLVFVLPGTIAGGRRVAQPVRTADIAPTVLELVGLPPMLDIQGVSLAPLLRGRAAVPDLAVYGESFEPLSIFGSNVLRFLRQGKWKYIHKVNPELFDLESDAGELLDLSEVHPEIVETMRGDLVGWVSRERREHSDSRAPIDQETLDQLAALGYMGEGAPPGFSEATDLSELRGVDPTTRIDDMEHYAIGLAALKSRNLDHARERFEPLYAENPESLPILRGLMGAFEEDEWLERGPGLLADAKRLDPDNPVYFIRLAEVYKELGDRDRAESQLRQALLIEECNTPTRVVLAEMLREWGRIREQKVLLETGIERCDGEVNFTNDLAYLLATSADDEVRDGREALRLARRAVKSSDVERPDLLDTLACAFAEVGNFRKAVQHSKRALELIERRDEPEAIHSAYLEHLESFQAGEPVRVGGG